MAGCEFNQKRYEFKISLTICESLSFLGDKDKNIDLNAICLAKLQMLLLWMLSTQEANRTPSYVAWHASMGLKDG